MNSDQSKKSGSFFEKFGQRISTFRDDITDNIERRKQSYNQANNVNNNQVQFIYRPNLTEDSLTIEKKPPSPVDTPYRQTSGKKIITDCI